MSSGNPAPRESIGLIGLVLDLIRGIRDRTTSSRSGRIMPWTISGVCSRKSESELRDLAHFVIFMCITSLVWFLQIRPEIWQRGDGVGGVVGEGKDATSAQGRGVT